MPPKDKLCMVGQTALTACCHRSRNGAERACSFVRVFNSLADGKLNRIRDNSISGHQSQRVGESWIIRRQSTSRVVKPSDCERIVDHLSSIDITGRQSQRLWKNHGSFVVNRGRRSPNPSIVGESWVTPRQSISQVTKASECRRTKG